MKLKAIISVCCCVALVALSSLTAYAAPEDEGYLDDIYNWASSTVSDIVNNSSDDTTNDWDSSDNSSYYDDTSSDLYDDTSSEDNSSDYYESETYYEYQETQPEENSSQDTSSNWYDWFAVSSQEETQPATEALPEDNSSQTGTTEYVGYGFLMWVVIIVGVILTLAILTNTHLRKKS